MFNPTILTRTRCYQVYLLCLYGLLSLWQPVSAAIMVTAGAGQIVPAGSPSANIFFKVTDETGNPDTGTTVNFNLVDPAGANLVGGLLNNSANPDHNGLVFTRLESMGTIGNYVITARLTTDLTQFASTNVVVVAGAPSQLTVTAGDNQIIPANQNSADISFKLSDTFGNPITGQMVNFTVTTPLSETSNRGVFPTNLITDINGDVTTRLMVTTIEGTHTVIATLATNSLVTNQVKVQVTEALPQLPSLGFGMAINTLGNFVETNASFQGGISVNDGDFLPEVVLAQTDSVLIKGLITADSHHVGQPADIIIVASYSPVLPFDPQMWFMLNSNNVIQVWDVNMANLVAFTHVAQLPSKLPINMYGGKFAAIGQLQVYFGYRLENGLIVFNLNQVMSILIR